MHVLRYRLAVVTIVMGLGTGLTAQSSSWGTWTKVTPSNVNVSSDLPCGNFGVETVVVDPARPSNFYFQAHCQGIWKSTDYGATWTGPINTGVNGNGASGAGGIGIARGPDGQPPILMYSGIRSTGPAMGFWKSTDGGVNWSHYDVAASPANRQDYYPPVADPYDSNHLLMSGHEMNVLAQSFNGGVTWSTVPLNPGMNSSQGGTSFVFFIDTGNATTTANTWLFIEQASGGKYGTWRTTNGGSSWVKVDNNEHPHGAAQVCQPDASGVLFMAGVYSGHGWGVLRSADFGATWTHVGATVSDTIVWCTGTSVYSMYGWSCGLGCTVTPTWQAAALPASSGWTSPGDPAGMTQGATAAAVSCNPQTGHYNVVTANRNSVWRFVESATVTCPTSNGVDAPGAPANVRIIRAAP